MWNFRTIGLIIWGIGLLNFALLIDDPKKVGVKIISKEDKNPFEENKVDILHNNIRSINDFDRSLIQDQLSVKGINFFLYKFRF